MEDDTNPNILMPQAVIMTIMLGLQYLLGITTTLFIHFPDHASEQRMWQFAASQAVLVAHIVLGLFLLVGSIVFAFRSIRHRAGIWIALSALGFIAIMASFVTGVLFVPTQSDTYSYVMALGYLIAVTAYIWGIVATRR